MSEINREKAFRHAMLNAHQALKAGERRAARRWAEQAAAIDPAREEPWLILAAVASTRASIHYLDQALKINPGSTRARKGMHWAVQRLRAERSTPVPVIQARRSIITRPVKPEDHIRPHSVLVPWALAVLFVFLITAAWFGTPTLSMAFTSPQNISIAQIDVEKATPTFTPSATPTPTNTPTLTPTLTPTQTPLPTETYTPLPTDTPLPTNTPVPTATPTKPPTATPVPIQLPEGVEADDHWIDIDLTNQLTHAYIGDQLVRTFLVSTGTWQTPTVLGTYRVYVKYKYADMSGPGYYLPNVPFVMYFYQGYGIHGTYWHNNFGTPMSHGCINLTIDDAGWIFDFAVVGTVVHVHY